MEALWDKENKDLEYMKMPKKYWVWPTITQFIIWPIFWLLFKVFFKIEVNNRQNLRQFEKKPQNLIMALNHNSNLDSLFFSHILSNFSKLKPIFWVSSTRKMYETDQSDSFVKFFSRVGKYFGSYPAYRDKNHSNFDKKLQHHIKILSDKKVVCMFPEGRKSGDGQIQEGKIGVSVLSQRTDTPILPIRMHGTSNLKLFSGKRDKVVINIGKPMYPQDFFSTENPSHEYYKKVTEVLMDRIKNL